MDYNKLKNELIVKTTLELLQNVLPTNIMTNLEQLDTSSNSDASELANDLDEDFFFQISRTYNQAGTESEAETYMEPQFVAVPEFNENGGEQTDNNSSLTYFEIVEQEMMQSLSVTKQNILVFSQIISDFPEIGQSNLLSELNLQSVEQLTNLLVYALMSNEMSHQIEQTMLLEAGVVNTVVEILSEIIAQKKDAFIQWPTDDEILQNVRDFESYKNDNDNTQFPSVFGAIGTIEIPIKPALPRFYTISQPSCSSRSTHSTYTPVKWQCSCDTNGFLQSSLVFIPTNENQSKNSYVFEVNPMKMELEQQSSGEFYMVADETLTIFPVLLTPHEKRIIDADPFNRALHSKRIVIDRTFEKIQQRFPLLGRIEHRDAHCVRNIIETVGILHNFFMIHRDDSYIDGK